VIDEELPLIVVHHATSEVPGMQTLAGYLRRQFPRVRVEFYGPQCLYSLIAPPGLGRRQLRMIRDDLSYLPAMDLPAGYRIEHLQKGQEAAYVEVMRDALYAGASLEGWFQRTFTSDAEYDPANLFIAWRDKEPVGAAAAWQGLLDGEPIGVVHMVGVVHRCRGAGLGKAVSLAALHRLRERGFKRVMLDTDDWRVPAIKAYLRLGFTPFDRDGSLAKRWQRVMERIEAAGR
jgi:mycothiol synthase